MKWFIWDRNGWHNGNFLLLFLFYTLPHIRAYILHVSAFNYILESLPSLRINVNVHVKVIVDAVLV